MSDRLRVASIGASLAVSLVPTASSAAPREPSRAADTVYSDARAALDRGDYEKACPLFHDYYELDPTPAALFTMAECEARWGKAVDAVTHFEAFLRRTDAEPSPLQEQRTRMAYEQVARLQTLIARVWPVWSSSPAEGAEVHLDGIAVQMPAAHPLVVAAGDHLLDITRAGVRREIRFGVAAGEVRRIELGAAGAEPAAPEPRAPTRGASDDGKARPEPGERAGGPVLSLPAPVMVAGGLGAAATITGVVFGALAWNAKGDVDAHCVDARCDHTGKVDADRAQSFATVSTVSFVVGAVALASALTLYFVMSRDPSRARPSALADVTRF